MANQGSEIRNNAGASKSRHTRVGAHTNLPPQTREAVAAHRRLVTLSAARLKGWWLSQNIHRASRDWYLLGWLTIYIPTFSYIYIPFEVSRVV